jgi:hypothetical protein
MAWVLYLVFDAGWYYRMIVPAVACLPVAGAVYLAVGLGHCRNVWVAGFLGVVAGLVFYLGHFHAHLVSLAGPQALVRFDVLPEFITARMAGDVEVDVQGRVKPPRGGGNWVAFTIELLMVCTLVGLTGVMGARAAYCEDCRRWKRRLRATAAPGTGAQLVRALEGGLEHLPPVAAYTVGVNRTCSIIEAEHCPAVPHGLPPCPVFLTVKESWEKVGISQREKTLLRQAVVSPEEVEILADRIAALQPLLGIPVPPPVSVPGRTGLPAAAVEPAPDDGSVVEPPLAVQVPLALGPILAVLTWIGLLVTVYFVRGPVRLSLLIAGLAALVFGVFVCGVNADFFNIRFIYGMARRRVRDRGDALVNPDDPDAVYLTIVPRAH